MGVRGLTTYINNNENIFLESFLLHDTCLVIDGHSLCAQLYRNLNCFAAFGGDYDKIATYVKKFFHSLRKCNIKCYILFDGSYETRKLRTAYCRLKSKIYGASRLDPVTQSGLQIFPFLLRDVFKSVLTELKIPYTVCEFEADDEIATMARYLNCPVLSYDSDFFIYNVLYIPFNTLELKPVPIEENNKKIFVMECRIYKVENFVHHFGGLKEELLPLLATLLGNDYVQKRLFKNFFSHLKMPKSKMKKNEQQRSIDGVLRWLRGETFESAIEKIVGRVKNHRKQHIYNIIKRSIDGYNRTHCRSLKYFNIEGINSIEKTALNILDENTEWDNKQNDSNVSSDEDVSDDDNKSVCSDDILDEDGNEDIDSNASMLPEWCSNGIRTGAIPQSFINLYTHHLHFCSPQAEDYAQEDSFICTLPLLRYSFDILTNFSQENCIYVSREKENYHRLSIGKDYSISPPYHFDSCDGLITDAERLPLCFEHFLKEKMPNFNLGILDLLPKNYRLTMLSILWWVLNCNVTLSCVYSLFLCYIVLEVIDEKTGTFRGHHFFINKYSKKVEELLNRQSISTITPELHLNKNKVSYEDCLIAAKELLMYFEMDSEIKKRPRSYDHRRVHVFAQFQCCMQQFNNLNTLCRYQYDNTMYYKCFNGTFLYNVSKKLDKHIDPIIYIEKTILKGADTVLQYFKSLCSVYEQCVAQLGVTLPKVIGKKHSRRKKNKAITFLCKEFESEVII